MNCLLDYNEFIKKYFSLDNNKNWKNTFVYSYNNGGKTFLLLSFVRERLNYNVELCFNNKKIIPLYFIPVARLDLDEYNNDNNMRDYQIKKVDLNLLEDEKKQIEKQINYVNYFVRFRNYILNNIKMKNEIENAIKIIFQFKEFKLENYHNSSDGVKNVINILTSIFVKREEYQEEIASYGKFLIVIDEIELFLHPKSQIELINYLFSIPQTVYLFTSHSPFLIQRFENINILSIEEHKYRPYEKNMYYMSLDYIFNEYFEINRYPDDINDFLTYLNNCVLDHRKFDKEKYRAQICSLRVKYPHLNLMLNNICLDFIYKMEQKKINIGDYVDVICKKK